MAPLHAAITITGSFNRTAEEWESGTFTRNAFLANNGSATLTVDSGSTLTFSGNTNLFGTGQVDPPYVATITLTDTGSRITTTRGLTLGNNTGVATMSILNGARLVTTERVELGGGGNLGDSSTSSGSVTVDGLGSLWEANGGINVGQFAQGSLTIQNQGQVTSTEVFVARGDNATGSLTITGNGGTNYSELVVTDTLNIQEGGTASFSNSARVNAGGVFSVSGLATAEGANTTITSSDFVYVSSGDRGATLTIKDGARVITDRTTLGSDTGDGSNNSGTLIVEGNGSLLRSTRAITIGSANGDGTLNIKDGGVVEVLTTNQNVNVLNGSLNITNGTLVVGQVNASGSGTVNFNNGTLRLADNQSSLFNGFSTDSVVFDTGGATIDTQHFTVSTNASLTGTGGLTKEGSGTLTLAGTNSFTGETSLTDGTLRTNNLSGNLLQTGGIFSPGQSPATTTIGGDYTMNTNSTLLIEIGGLMQGTEYDFLDVTGSINLAGQLEAILIDDFSPTFGDSFSFLSSAVAINGSFDIITLPSLTNGLTWDLSDTGQQRVLTAVPEPTSHGLLLLGGLVFMLSTRRVRRVLKRE